MTTNEAREALLDALEYDADNHALIRTERLGPNEYGAAQIVAHGVAPSFGVWAEAMWRDGVVRADAEAKLAALREALEDIALLYTDNRTRPAMFAIRAGEIAVAAIDATEAER